VEKLETDRMRVKMTTTYDRSPEFVLARPTVRVPRLLTRLLTCMHRSQAQVAARELRRHGHLIHREDLRQHVIGTLID
jgi:hypothetical protein